MSALVLGSLRLECFPHNDGVSVVVTTALGPQELRMSVGDWASLQRLVDVLAAADRQHALDRAELLRMDVALAASQPLRSLLSDWQWSEMDWSDLRDPDLAERVVKAFAHVEAEMATVAKDKAGA